MPPVLGCRCPSVARISARLLDSASEFVSIQLTIAFLATSSCGGPHCRARHSRRWRGCSSAPRLYSGGARFFLWPPSCCLGLEEGILHGFIWTDVVPPRDFGGRRLGCVEVWVFQALVCVGSSDPYGCTLDLPRQPTITAGWRCAPLWADMGLKVSGAVLVFGAPKLSSSVLFFGWQWGRACAPRSLSRPPFLIIVLRSPFIYN